MNIVERGRSWLQKLRDLAGRTAWAWRRCPYCGQSETWKHGSYSRRPWFLEGKQTVVVQRHWCRLCQRTYSEQSALLVRGSWYARDVHRVAVDEWQYLGGSMRRTAEWLRSWLGRQERWRQWRPLDAAPEERERCWLSASTVARWLDRAGQVAATSVQDQLRGAEQSGQMGTDGLWARLRGGAKGVVLGLMDSATGLLWPPVVASDEGEAAWEALFTRAKQAGLDLDRLRGVTSDGATGLGRYLVRGLAWVNHQRCVWHVWRQLGGEFRTRAAEAARGLVGAAALRQRRQVRRELADLVRAVLDAAGEAAAQQALGALAAHPFGTRLAQLVAAELDALRIYQCPFNRGLLRVGPEWYWRDFRLRLSHGRNHGSSARLERAALVWAVARNFTPAQGRSERKRHYRAPGQSPLQRAGLAPEGISYLDALAV